MKLTRPATLDDVQFVTNQMRVEDIEEVKALGLSPLDALTLGYETSLVTYTLLTPDTNEPGALLGVAPSTNPMLGAIWLLGTDSIVKHRFTFLRNSRPTLAALFEETQKEAFYNITFCENTVHHLWLRWLGFTFLRKVNAPPLGQPFYEFMKLKG